MAKSEREGTRRVPAKAASAHQKRKRRVALGKADILEPGPLIAAGRYEQEAADYVARACHRVIKQSGTLKRPLHERGEQCASDPDKEIAGTKPKSCREWRVVSRSLSAHTGVHEHHWQRRWRHHADHHHGPHGEYQRE